MGRKGGKGREREGERNYLMTENNSKDEIT